MQKSNISLALAAGILLASGSSLESAHAYQSKITPLPEASIQPIKASQSLRLPQKQDDRLRLQVAQSDSVPNIRYANFFISESKENPWPQKTFDCVGGIYAAIRFDSDNHQLRNSTLKVEWINPQGDLELVSKRPHYKDAGDKSFRIGGMILKRPEGGGLFSLLDHSAGMERFIGDWQAKYWLGGKHLRTLNFTVEC